MATSEGIPSSIDIEFLELNDNPYFKISALYFLRQAMCFFRRVFHHTIYAFSASANL